jgi:rod shape-determining protein MreC
MNRNKQTEFLGGIITLVILILLIFLSNVETGKLSYLQSAVNTIITPVQRLFTDFKNKIQKNDSYFAEMDELKAENEELRSKNSDLETELRELEVIKAENATLQEYMNLTQKYSEYQTIPAYVINKDVSNLSSNLIINVGSKDGIEKNMTVIADKGLVGHVISVTDSTATVQVIIDAASTVSAKITTSDESIICKGTLEDNQILRATYIPTGAELIQGDSVSTSGIGGIYPQGIYIGTIKEIITTSNIIDRYAVIEPAVDFEKVSNVLVVTNK